MAVFSVIYQSAGSQQGSNAGLYMMLILTVLLSPLWFAAIRSIRPKRKRWAGFRAVLDAGAGTMRRGRITGHFRGREVALFSSRLGEHKYYFNIRVACSSPLHFEIWPRALIEIGKPKNSFEIGDADLDRSFHFTSDDPVRLKAWFLTPENNRDVIALLRQGQRRCGLQQEDGSLTWQIQNDLSNDLTLDPVGAPQQGPQTRRLPAISREKANEQERERIREVLEILTQLASRIEGRD